MWGEWLPLALDGGRGIGRSSHHAHRTHEHTSETTHLTYRSPSLSLSLPASQPCFLHSLLQASFPTREHHRHGIAPVSLLLVPCSKVETVRGSSFRYADTEWREVSQCPFAPPCPSRSCVHTRAHTHIHTYDRYTHIHTPARAQSAHRAQISSRS